jgi:hypothetical protein
VPTLKFQISPGGRKERKADRLKEERQNITKQTNIKRNRGKKRRIRKKGRIEERQKDRAIFG